MRCVYLQAQLGTCRSSREAESFQVGRAGRRFAVAVCDLPGGARCYARSEDEGFMQALEAEEWVGRDVQIEEGEGSVNRMVS